MLIFVFKSSCDQEFCHIVIIYISNFGVWSVRQCVQYVIHLGLKIFIQMINRLIAANACI